VWYNKYRKRNNREAITMATLHRTEFIKIYNVVATYRRDERECHIALTLAEARALADELTDSGEFEYVRVEKRLITTELRRDILDSYLASIGM
jgi:hypothetical protein